MARCREVTGGSPQRPSSCDGGRGTRGGGVEYSEILAGCVKFLTLWFLFLATGVAAFVPTVFVLSLFDKDYRAKWKGYVLTAYCSVRAFIERHDRSSNDT